MKLFLSIIFCASFSFIQAREMDISYHDFDLALSGENKVQFDMESTKFGMLTTSFTGVAKRILISYEVVNSDLSNIKVIIPVISLDTDIDARNEKMFNLCFDSKVFPNITIIVPTIKIDENVADATIEIRGVKFPIKINTKSTIKETQLDLSFDIKLSLKKLGIPDPSIFIAKVNDEVNVSGVIIIER